MLWPIEDFFCDPFLHDSPQVHHGYAISKVANGCEVMRDVEESAAFLLLNVFQQVEDLSTDREVKSRRWLIANHQWRLQSKRSADGHTLTLPTGKLMRISIQESIVQTDFLKNSCRGALLSDNSLWLQGRLADGPFRVEAGVRVLPNHPNLFGQRARRTLHIQAVKFNFSGR